MSKWKFKLKLLKMWVWFLYKDIQITYWRFKNLRAESKMALLNAQIELNKIELAALEAKNLGLTS